VNAAARTVAGPLFALSGVGALLSALRVGMRVFRVESMWSLGILAIKYAEWIPPLYGFLDKKVMRVIRTRQKPTVLNDQSNTAIRSPSATKNSSITPLEERQQQLHSRNGAVVQPTEIHRVAGQTLRRRRLWKSAHPYQHARLSIQAVHHSGFVQYGVDHVNGGWDVFLLGTHHERGETTVAPSRAPQGAERTRLGGSAIGVLRRTPTCTVLGESITHRCKRLGDFRAAIQPYLERRKAELSMRR